MGCLLTLPLSCVAASACSCCTTLVASAICSCQGLVPAPAACGLHIGLAALVGALALSAQQWSANDLVLGSLRLGGDRSFGGMTLCGASRCSGDAAVLRCSLALGAFFALLALLTLPTSTFATTVHRGLWPLKLMLLPAALVSTLWLDASLLVHYAQFASILALAYLILQAVLLIGFAMDWNSTWVDADASAGNDEGLCGLKGLLLAISAFAYGVSGYVLTGLLGSADAGAAAHLAGAEEASACGSSRLLVWVLVVVMVLLSTLSLCKSICPHGNVLTSSLVTAYATYLCWSALVAHPETACRPPTAVGDPAFARTMSVGVGMGLAALALLSAANTASASAPTADARSSPALSPDAVLIGAPVTPAESWGQFHATLAASSAYLAVLLTGWAADVGEQQAGASTASWPLKAQAGALLGLVLLYAWVLLAPYLLRDVRDFGVQFDDDSAPPVELRRFWSPLV